MKKFFTILCLFMLLLCSCTRVPDSYPFPNRLEPIASVELLHNMNPGGSGIDEINMVMLYSLNETEIKEFMDALYELPTTRVGTPPPYGYGQYVAKVSYENGDIEMYGPYNMEHVQVGEQVWGIGDYRFTSGEDFESLFAQYVDLKELPEPPSLD